MTQDHPPNHVILRLNIGEGHHQWVTNADLRQLEIDDPAPKLIDFAQEFDRDTFTPRQWRALARELDRLVEAVREAAQGTARIIISGRAPLPVFAYLGARMVRVQRCSVANDLHGKWDLFGPPKPPGSEARQTFQVAAPELGRKPDGRFALSVQCSGEYRPPDDSIEQLLEAEGAAFLGTYAIHRANFHRSDPLTNADLPVLLGHVEGALAWIGERVPSTPSLMVPIAGPSWAAFWIGHRLVPTVCGRFDLPNFVPGLGYLRALSYPMAKAPWLAGKARLLLMHAEPKNQARTRAARSFDEVQRALEQEHGRDGPYELRHRGAAEIREFMREVELTNPDILHLHLHGAPTGDLAFEDARGETERFTAKRFVNMLRATRVQPAVIVLNACHSANLAPSLLGIAECVVAMKGKAGVDDVIAFSRDFYGAIARGNDLQTAIDQGRAGADIENVEVLVEGDVNPKNIILMPQPRKRG